MINIKDIFLRGRYYSYDDVEPWFCLTDNRVYETTELIGDHSFNSRCDIEKSGEYIPFFRTDIIELKKEFIQRYFPQLFNEIFCNKNDDDDNTAFNIFAEENDHLVLWYRYERARLQKDAIDWCNAHGLPYIKGASYDMDFGTGPNAVEIAKQSIEYYTKKPTPPTRILQEGQYLYNGLVYTKNE